jgi:DNA modification methylase
MNMTDLVIIEENSQLAPILNREMILAKIEETRTVDEAMGLLNTVSSMQVYLKAEKQDAEIQNQVAEMKVRTQRKLGQLIKQGQESGEIAGHGGDRKSIKVTNSYLDTKTLDEVGIDKMQAHRFKAIAEIPEEVFDTEIRETIESKKEVTTAGLLKVGKEIKKADALADKRDEIATAFKAEIKVFPNVYNMHYDDYLELIANDSVDLLITDPPYSTDVADIEAFAADWLPKALNKVKKSGRAYICIGAYPKEVGAYLKILLAQDKFILDNPLIWSYKNTLGVTPKMKYNLNYQVILHLYSDDSAPLDTGITNEMFSVMEINAPDGRLGDRFHTWQKPDELAMRLVRHSTQVGDSVIDPFCCTGSFLLAAAKLKRNASGCDISLDNLKISEQRGCKIQYNGVQ